MWIGLIGAITIAYVLVMSVTMIVSPDLAIPLFLGKSSRATKKLATTTDKSKYVRAFRITGVMLTVFTITILIIFIHNYMRHTS